MLPVSVSELKVGEEVVATVCGIENSVLVSVIPVPAVYVVLLELISIVFPVCCIAVSYTHLTLPTILRV